MAFWDSWFGGDKVDDDFLDFEKGESFTEGYDQGYSDAENDLQETYSGGADCSNLEGSFDNDSQYSDSWEEEFDDAFDKSFY